MDLSLGTVVEADCEDGMTTTMPPSAEELRIERRGKRRDARAIFKVNLCVFGIYSILSPHLEPSSRHASFLVLFLVGDLPHLAKAVARG